MGMAKIGLLGIWIGLNTIAHVLGHGGDHYLRRDQIDHDHDHDHAHVARKTKAKRGKKKKGKSSKTGKANTAMAPFVTFKHLLTRKAQGFYTGPNICEGKKPKDPYFDNVECFIDMTIAVLEQAGANITVGYQGGMDAGGREPILEPYWKEGLCPVNVHWHLGAEHLSVGEFDENGKGPVPLDEEHRRMQEHNNMNRDLAGGERLGFQCHHYDENDPKFTTEYGWQFCQNMLVGQTYEIHWPHSAAGACGTPNQYQYTFYDGVFCNDGIITLDPLNTYRKIGVQGQVFTIVNDEDYYYPHLIRGMVVDGDKGKDITYYTGSTTGTTRDNVICSKFTPITWQVDRKCHLISASSMDRLCADMMTERDDMDADTFPHGAREMVIDQLAANNQVFFN